MTSQKDEQKRSAFDVLNRELDENFLKRLERKLVRRFACGGLSLLFIFVVLVPLFLVVSCVACADGLKDFPP